MESQEQISISKEQILNNFVDKHFVSVHDMSNEKENAGPQMTFSMK